MSLIHNATFDSQTRVLSLLDKAGNVISSCEVPSKDVDDPNKPLMLRATKDNSSVMLKRYGSLSNTYQTSTNGEDWTDYTFGTAIRLNKGESVYFRCSSHPSTQTSYNYVRFDMTGEIEAWHNAYSMISSDFSSAEESVGDYGMNGLFEYCTPLTKAPLLLNALSPWCYYGTFYDCVHLTQAPALPATTLAEGCYVSMFYLCTSLTQSPALPATALAKNCYSNMFFGCSKLKEVRISATTTATDALKDWLKNVAATGDFYCDPNAKIFPTGASGIPSGWRRIHDVDDITKPLTFKATKDGSSVKLKKTGTPSGSFQTSRDGGNTWADYTLYTAITLNTGEKVSFRAKSDRTSAQGFDNNFYFEMTGKIEAWHNVMSLYRTNDFATYESVVGYAFSHLFSGCTSLVKAPALPATILADSCYWNMFIDCQSLTKAPELPATTLAKDCYYDMFRECPKLKEVRVSATTTAKNALYTWLSGVAATGDFYCDPSATIFPTGTSGIPANWNRHALADYPVTP